ncbi:MAG: exonuclease SbcCD subunit D [Oscillospiraceae bacterium]|nr:exonuclease SbcCD subunit D [Oscillospiraceae bacterium]
MKWIHTSDLHIGKQLNEFSLLEDQRFFLERLVELAQKERPDLLLLSGDLYDRSVPSAEAVGVLDAFLSRMSIDLKIPILAIAGNHDSPQRLEFCSRLLRTSGLYLAGNYRRIFEQVTFFDPWGPVHFYLCPYLEPALVRADFPGKELRSFDDAFGAVLDENLPQIDFSQRNVLLAHGFFSYLKNPDSVARSESEVSLGGSDLIDAKRLEQFDYAALGHIHRPQTTGREHLCYSGSPLKYSQSEIPYQKSVVIGQLCEKGNLTLERRSLPVLRDMRIIRGTFDEILRHTPDKQAAQDLIFFSLEDQLPIPNAMNRLRAVYPNALGLRIGQRENPENLEIPDQKAARPMDLLFQDFYQSMTGGPMLDGQDQIVRKICESIEAGGGTDEADPAGI